MSKKVKDAAQAAEEEKQTAQETETSGQEKENEPKAAPEKATGETQPEAQEPEEEKESKDTKGKKRGREKELEAQLEKVTGELAENKDKYLRLLAEYDNYRKRTTREKERIYSDAIIKIAGELLNTVDNLERAVASVGDDTEKEGGFYKGVEMTLKQLNEQFRHLGVEPIESSEGTPFDPRFHEAIMHEDDGSGETCISATLRRGYTLGETIVRPALVKTRG